MPGPKDSGRYRKEGFRKQIKLDPVSVGVSYDQIQGKYNNTKGSKFSGGIRIGGDDDKKEASDIIEDDPDVMGSTDIDALVYHDEEFEIKQTEEWQQSHRPGIGEVDKGKKRSNIESGKKKGPRIAPPPPEW